MITVIDIAKAIDPEAWTEADNFAQGAEAASPQMRPFFENQAQRLIKPSIEAAMRVAQLLQPPSEPPTGEAMPEPASPAGNRKARRAKKGDHA